MLMESKTQEVHDRLVGERRDDGVWRHSTRPREIQEGIVSERPDDGVLIHTCNGGAKARDSGDKREEGEPRTSRLVLDPPRGGKGLQTRDRDAEHGAVARTGRPTIRAGSTVGGQPCNSGST